MSVSVLGPRPSIAKRAAQATLFVFSTNFFATRRRESGRGASERQGHPSSCRTRSRQVELVADRLERPGLALERRTAAQCAAPARKGISARRTGGAATPRPLERVGGLTDRRRDPRARPRRGAAVWFSGRRGRRKRLATCCIGGPVASASSCFVASRPSSTSSRRAAARKLLALDDDHRHARRPRGSRQRCRLADHQVAWVGATPPVEPPTARFQASVPSWIRSRSGRPASIALRNRNDQRRFDSIMRRSRWRAALDRLREHDLVSGGQRLVAADVGGRALKAVGAPLAEQRLGGGQLGLASRAPSRPRRQASRSRARSLELGRQLSTRSRQVEQTPRARPAR